MCGLCGFIDPSATQDEKVLQSTVAKMCDRIVHRGPDAQGQWADPDYGVALGHRRLSIIDVSSAGNQPMISASGRYVVAFNGEIYNFKTIAKQLEAEKKAPAWRGHCDTEVLLAALEAWGVERSLGQFNGMFAIVAWDAQEKKLIAARDRCGKKPLYYGWINGVFMFGSELKALMAHPRFTADIDVQSLSFFFSHSYIPSPKSIFTGIAKLSPGSYFEFGANEIRGHTYPSVATYWNAAEKYAAARRNGFPGSPQDAVARLDELMRDAVRLRMAADVALGAFLSGGVDSSLVVSLMQRESSSPVKTFTIGFPGESSDESGFARALARHLGTEHTEIAVTAQDALNVVPRLAEIYDEPFADDSQIPTWLVCGNCRDHVTVALSGDGGDELFAGYDSYRRVMRNWPPIALMPWPIRRMAASVFMRFSQEKTHVDGEGRIEPRRSRLLKRLRVAQKLKNKTFAEFFQWYMSFDKIGHTLLRASAAPCPSAFSRGGGTILEQMLLADFRGFLADDVLVKVDRASMNVSLEVRNPLLDYRVIEFAWALPHRMLIDSNAGKLLLRSLLYRIVPRELVDRPKASFGIPISQWLRTDLRSWGDGLLDESRLRRQGILHADVVRRLWREHQECAWDHGRLLWNILMFESWHARYREA